MTEPPIGVRNRWLHRVQVTSLVVLCAVGAELLAAYGDSTGHLGRIAFAVAFFGALYGAPALLVRETARRAGWGWPSLLLLMLALAITEACVIDQSLFSDDYQGYDGWEQTREATLIRPLGISVFNAYNFLTGHIIFSFGAPIALAEAWRPHRATTPWLGPVGLLLAGLAYVGAAILIAVQPESHSASLPQLIASVTLVAGCIVLAWLVGRRRRCRVGTPASTSALGPAVTGRGAPSVAVVLLITLILAATGGFAGETWAGFVLGSCTTGAAAGLIWWASGRPGWGLRHIAAVGLGFLTVRGLFAFLYFPLIGDVSAGPKYTHNVVMLLLVLLAGWFALRR